MKRKQLLSESQIKRLAQIAGIPAIGIVSEKVDIQAEDTETEETTNEDTVDESAEIEEGGKYYEEDEDPTDAASMEVEEPAAEEVPQEKIESLVDAVLAAIEQETGVPAQRVEDEAPAEEEPVEEPAEEPEAEMDAEEPAEDEMLEGAPTLAERIAAAVQSVLDEDTALEESSCDTTNEEEETEQALEEITKAVVSRLRSITKDRA